MIPNVAFHIVLSLTLVEKQKRELHFLSTGWLLTSTVVCHCLLLIAMMYNLRGKTENNGRKSQELGEAIVVRGM